jgi:peptidoglycan hydrolase-like protein with peptidoglycan-binding domain
VKFHAFFLLILCVLFAAPIATADEQIRQIQEELRKRNLYYGDIDGKGSPALAEAIARYQQRKGFATTGAVDDPTLRSLGISAPAPVIAGDDLPEVPVLKSDLGLRARDFRFVSGPPSQDAAREPAPPPGRDQVIDFIRRYFAACETTNAADELDFYADRIDYFGRGAVDKNYVKNDLETYDDRWPTRKYTVGDSIRVSSRGDKVVARCRVSFTVIALGGVRRATGKTDHTFTLGRRGDSGLEIVSIKEVRVRPPSPSKSRAREKKRPPTVMQRASNTVKKLLHGRDSKPRRWENQRP